MRIETIKLYVFDELNNEAKNKAISDHIDFIIETMTEDSYFWQYHLQMERMQTPWFLGCVIFEKAKDVVAEEIRINEYEFTSDGKFYFSKL